MKILHQNNNNHIIVEYCVKQNCIYSVHSTWLYSTSLILSSAPPALLHTLLYSIQAGPDPLDEEHIYDTIYNFYIINWGDCMKGVIDMDEINFSVIIKGVGLLVEETCKVSNEGGGSTFWKKFTLVIGRWRLQHTCCSLIRKNRRNCSVGPL